MIRNRNRRSRLASHSPDSSAQLSRHSSEFGWIAKIAERERDSSLAMSPLALGIGDDAAVVPSGTSDRLLIATDTLLEGVHFETSAAPRAIGHKAIAVNLSDIAAMGGIPTAATVAISASPKWSNDRLDRLMIGLQRTAHQYSVSIVGGDTTAWNGRLALTVTVVGTPGPRGVITRSGGQPGDRLFVTGPLGRSILGHHLTFCPRVNEAISIAEAVDIHAMIDISDGLASDIRHLTVASSCGATIDTDRIPMREPNIENALEHALTDGEDFELLFAVPPSEQANVPSYCAEIGQLDAEPGIRLSTPSGLTDLNLHGYSHTVVSNDDE